MTKKTVEKDDTSDRLLKNKTNKIEIQTLSVKNIENIKRL